MQSLWLSLSVTLLICLASSQATTPLSSVPPGAPIVDLGYVKYVGRSNATSGISTFRGIPFAQPPTGELRWQKPRSIESKNDFNGRVYNATQVAPGCYQSQPESQPKSTDQSSNGRFPSIQSEDCLYLDILRPMNASSGDRLPVLLMIHGGGYTEGYASTYPGDALVHASLASEGMLYVSIQYRLGIFGFLGGSEIAENGVLNAGLLDQRAALEWVQRNIRSFGGDPTRVTVFGNSAGGGSVTFQLTANSADDEPPFAAAIAEYPWWQPMLNQSMQESQLFKTYQLSNCSSVQCLRGLSGPKVALLGQQVIDASYPGPELGYGVFYYGPVVDGGFVPDLPSQSFKLGKFYDVPLLVDHDAYEGYVFSDMSQVNQVEVVTDARSLFPFAGQSFFSRLFQLYPRSDYNSTFFQRQTWFGDFIISCPTYEMASSAVDHNSNKSAIFKLTFAAGTQLHGATGAFLFSDTTSWPAANNNTLAEIMASYWTSFAQTHDPNPYRSESAPFWPSYISGGNGTVADGESVGFTVQEVTYNSIGANVDPDANAKCEFFGNNHFAVMN